MQEKSVEKPAYCSVCLTAGEMGSWQKCLLGVTKARIVCTPTERDERQSPQKPEGHLVWQTQQRKNERNTVPNKVEDDHGHKRVFRHPPVAKVYPDLHGHTNARVHTRTQLRSRGFKAFNFIE